MSQGHLPTAAPAEGGSFLPLSASGAPTLLGLWLWPAPLPLSLREGQDDLSKDPPSKQGPILRLWVGVNVGGMPFDPVPCSSHFGVSSL